MAKILTSLEILKQEVRNRISDNNISVFAFADHRGVEVEFFDNKSLESYKELVGFYVPKNEFENYAEVINKNIIDNVTIVNFIDQTTGIIVSDTEILHTYKSLDKVIENASSYFDSKRSNDNLKANSFEVALVLSGIKIEDFHRLRTMYDSCSDGQKKTINERLGFSQPDVKGQVFDKGLSEMIVKGKEDEYSFIHGIFDSKDKYVKFLKNRHLILRRYNEYAVNTGIINRTEPITLDKWLKKEEF